MRRLGLMITLVLVPALLLATGVANAAEFDQFGLEDVSAELSTHEAGAHPDFTTTLAIKTDPNSPAENGEHLPYALLKDVLVAMPPGLVGNLNAVDQCTDVDFVMAKTGASGCPFASQVGISEIRIRGGEPGVLGKSPIYNMEPPNEDVVARFGFFVMTAPVFIDVHVRSNSDYGVTAEIRNVSALSAVLSARTTLWGVPAAESHDTLRFTAEEVLESKQQSPPRSAEHELAPFLTNPTNCSGPLQVGFEADSYQEPGRFVRETAPLGEITGCEGLDFEPSISLETTSHEAASPSGADAVLTLPQHEGWDERATSQLQDAVVRLPEGVTVSPGAADGLAACSEEQVGYRVSPPSAARCPDASKIGTAEIDSPSLRHPISGALYQRTPEPGHLTRAWLVVDGLGVHLKIPGDFQLDPANGRITSLFLDAPQLPLRSLRLHLFGGPRGVLATPRRCGAYQTEYRLTPWAGGADTEGVAPMTIDQRCEAGGFSPRLQVTPWDMKAGAFAPLSTVLTLASGEQGLSRLSVTMPPGVLAKLKGVELCSEPSAASGECPEASRVGGATVATGFGPNPLWVPQPGKSPTAAYLAGPYQGAPYSLVVRVPAEAGPFDLGDVITRIALHVDPATAQVTAASDPLPQMLEGIPIIYREVRVALDRPHFTINPTSCDPMQAVGSASSVEDATADLSSRFQVGGCEALPFKPSLKLGLRGAMRRSGDPALTATLKMPTDGANIAWARVTLPDSVQIDNAHISNPCTRVQFDAETCPKRSILGTAVAVSPLLGKVLTGPVYFRSNGGERALPDIVADLRGPIHVVLVGYIDSKKQRIRSTFAQIPDAPVSSFKISLFGGKRGLLENNRNLCLKSNGAVVQFNGHNGKTADFSSSVRLACSRHKD
jgi:hypothetical protein